MNPVPGRFRKRLASGVVVLIPLVVTVYALRVLFGFTTGILLPIIAPVVDHLPPWAQAALSLGILLLIVYLLGEIATHVLGRRVLAVVDAVVLKVPIVRTIYGASKKVASALDASEARAFKAVVWVEFPRPGMRALAFVTSSTRDAEGREWKSVFVPTTPNPTTGFLQLLPGEDVVETGFTVQQAFEMIMSLGVLLPGTMRASKAPSG